MELYKGYAYGVIIGVVSSAQQISAQYLFHATKIFPSTELVAIINVISFLCSGFYIIGNGKSLIPGSKTDFFFALLYSFMSIVSNIILYWSFKYAPVADCTTIYIGIQIVTSVVFSRIILKERCHLLKISFLIPILVGVILCSRPDFLFAHSKSDSELNKRTIALTAVLVVGTLRGLAPFCIRKVTQTDSEIINLFSGFAGAVVCFLIVSITNDFVLLTSALEISLIILVSAFNFVRRFLNIKGMKCSVTNCLIGGLVEIPFCYLLSLAVLNTRFHTLSLIGAAIAFVFICLFISFDRMMGCIKSAI